VQETAQRAIQDLVPHNNCWGCGPNNPGGLRIKSYFQGTDVVCEWQPRPPYFAGPEHVLNGGIIGALIDCHSICTAIADIYQREGRAIGEPPDVWCVTASMSVTYTRPVSLFVPVRLVASVDKRGERSSVVDCVLSSEGIECARAEVVAVRIRDGWGEGG
jgi:acyl-coenzyme A thioesterase PaaI-like protein